ncbi:hypothetical protein PV328_004437 [Microctonus aethiopoides]|uniref:RRM domain-containing protein n=1 Tax=Microctonus aethiopoides TaxID=144406 RepID=A0AA39KLQ9_9HYME|nr:hypothetical protein PV328_004437 [Microctonus aethiopoides]
MSSASTGGTEGSSPASSPASAASQTMSAPKYGTLVPNRIFVGGISASTSEAELAQLFSTYGNVKATKIISDRAGVSKGYGFVTFETEEEAKRLQQESECIILRERKLNIAPAIKKQPFSRSFDGGSGSPPAVPTSPYYYTNGMGLPYQNSLTFYNAGAPAPGTPLAPPADPTAIYQAAGVFGPQAASAHQTYAPMMYPCPAPSMYMPQQYQYSPMPYESYYAGAAGAPQYLYATSTPTSNGNGGGGGGSSNAGNNGANGATSPAATIQHGLQSLPPGPTHYYTATGPPAHHHHHHPIQSGPGGGTQIEHPYYSFTAAGPPHPPPPHSHPQQQQQPPPQQQQQQQQQQHGGHIGLGDQQLLLFTTDATCQQSANNSDGQAISQEDTRSASSNSEHQTQQQSGINNNNETTHVSTSSTSLMPILPIKYPISNRCYTNYHPLTLHPSSLSHNSPMCPTTQTQTTDTDDITSNQMQCRTIVYHPVFIPNPYNTNNGSLLPTPPSSGGFDTLKIHDGINQINKSQYLHNRNQNGYNLYSSINHQIPLNKSTTKFPLIRSNNNTHNRRNNNSNTSTCHITTRSLNSTLSYNKLPNQYINSRNNYDNYSLSNTKKNYSDYSIKRNNNNSYVNNTKNHLHDNNNSQINDMTICKSESGNINDNNKTLSPPPAPYSPMTRPLPNLSPPNIQVQFYTAQSRYQSQNQPNNHQHHQQQQQQQPLQYQQQQQRRYGPAMTNQIGSSGRKSTDKFNTTGGQSGVMLRNNKFKVNGMMPNAGKNCEEGGAGDAQQTVGRMPLTPPGTPHNLQDPNQINDACHQMQALTL